MARVPLIGRLNYAEYAGLLLGLTLVLLELCVRAITIAMPEPIVHWFYNRSKSAFHRFTHRRKIEGNSRDILKARGFVEICSYFGYECEEHVVQTKDGYLLGLHRICLRKGEQAFGSDEIVDKPVIYLHHGLLMNSEVWIVNCEPERTLPFVLVEKGYDVWFGNNRGNKYSKKHIHLNSNETKFWDFCIDDFAWRDIPDSIEYILKTTKQSCLSYIGFSQGTAQSFASLSINPDLNEKVDCFIALAPALRPKGLRNPLVDALMKVSPNLMYLFFGRKAILPSTTFWQSVLYPPVFVRVIDTALSFLFGWKGKNITFHQKVAAYGHLYSFTSVKAVVHWFQIMRNASFQMYDDDVQAPLAINSAQFYKVAMFPTRNIRTPIVLIYGGIDSLVDIDDMLKELPKHTKALKVEGHEHLDLLWGRDVHELVFPHVFRALEAYSKSVRSSSVALSSKNASAVAPGLYNLLQQNNGTTMSSSRLSAEDRNASNGSFVSCDASLNVEFPKRRRHSNDSQHYDISDSGGIRFPTSKTVASQMSATIDAHSKKLQ